MPIFYLKPVVTLLDDEAWNSSPYTGECWVNAADEAEARGLVSGRYEDARVNIPGHSRGPSPWMDSRLVAAQRLDEPPAGMSIPNGVVIAEKQL